MSTSVDVPRLRSLQRAGLLVGIAGLAFSVFGYTTDTEQFYQSYLVAFIYTLGIPLGSLGFLVMQNLTNGGWGFINKRTWEAGASTLVLLAVFFLPVIMGMEALYPWANPEIVAEDALIQHKEAYLNTGGFMARAAFYFLVWCALAWTIRGWSRKQDTSPDESLTRRQTTLSGAGIPLVVLTLTFASIDWVMSLEPHWFSTIYGLIFLAGYGLMTLAFTAIVLHRIADQAPIAQVVKRSHFNDLGSLMLAFTMLWGYLNFSQFLIIYSGNLPEEIIWYLVRMRGGWGMIGFSLIFLHFALPFLLLLWRRNKENTGRLVVVACWILVIRWVDVMWLVKPAFEETAAIHWLDVTLLLGLGGIWLAFFVSQLTGAALLPVNDPRVARKLGTAEAH